MERSRPAPPTSSDDVGVVSLPRELPPLNTLLEEVRAPAAGRTDVDALLAGLAQPLPEGHSARERADLLLSILEDPAVANYTGSHGRSVRVATVQALMGLGYPYALEVPPEALAARDPQEKPAPESFFFSPQRKWGFWLVMAAAALVLIPLLIISGLESSTDMLLFSLGSVGGTTLIPTGLTVWGHNSGSSGLKGFGSIWLLLACLVWFIPSVLGLIGGFWPALIPIALGSAVLTGTWLMNSKT